MPQKYLDYNTDVYEYVNRYLFFECVYTRTILKGYHILANSFLQQTFSEYLFPYWRIVDSSTVAHKVILTMSTCWFEFV